MLEVVWTQGNAVLNLGAVRLLPELNCDFGGWQFQAKSGDPDSIETFTLPISSIVHPLETKSHPHLALREAHAGRNNGVVRADGIIPVAVCRPPTSKAGGGGGTRGCCGRIEQQQRERD